eukprot:CAMPEP_0181305184 /NCGR_PEP_ID=MMETSP1101-20121128/9579_1 /TAXON_ID=46948 /ORGANISM="Rhodomonas abbreviata, Strain Caron Lab Isolate" /LENGTH=568 /DNA_ID=CAMNT_0023411053 /DNA_START=22 /DNA_END=1728 /DNA_ORIENTATION=-
MFVVLIAVLGVLAAATAADVRMEPSVHTFSSPMWLQETIHQDDVVKMTIVLKHDKAAMQSFEKELIDLSTPSSKNYGKWLKPEEIKQRIAPTAASAKVVTDYLASFDVPAKDITLSKFGDMIHVHMPVKTANAALKTEFARFRSVSQRSTVLPRITKPYFLPSEVAQHVSIVGDIMRFPSMRSSLPSYGAEETVGSDTEFDSCGKDCSGFTTPDVLQAAYGYKTLSSSDVASGNSMSVAEFQLQYYDTKDLDSFGDACSVTSTVDTTIGGNVERICEAGGCVEALLDIEYIEAVANPIPLTVIYLSTFSLLDWVDQVISMEDPPLVHSVSYGNDEVQQTSAEYMESVNTQFMTAGAMGLSILFASGDQGVWGRSGVGATYNPDFPAGSPYVTAVGGTDFATKSVIGEETAWSCGGGGFSDEFATPEWQADAVADYFSKAKAASVLPDSDLYNSTGRGYPDVSALGGQVNPYCVGIKGGSFGGVSGTSASCPVVAGVFAQLNNLRLANKKSSLGWLNPLIYTNGDCFNDVNDGSMNNCNRGTTGFAALSGWDPATGFGSPNYECLAKLM